MRPKEYWLEQAAKWHAPRPDVVCVGYGDKKNNLVDELDVDYGDLYCQLYPANFGWVGDLSGQLYYLRKEKWDELFMNKIDIKKEYRTRDGKEVRIYATDAGGNYPIHGAMKKEDGLWECDEWTKDGNWSTGGEGSDSDLIEISELDKARKAAPSGWLVFQGPAPEFFQKQRGISCWNKKTQKWDSSFDYAGSQEDFIYAIVSKTIVHDKLKEMHEFCCKLLGS